MLKYFLALLAVVLAGCAQLLRNTPEQDAQLVRQIVQLNLDEIADGKLAASKAQSRAVRQHAQRVVREHRQLQSEASELSSAGGAPLPTAHDYTEHRSLERLSGAQFDRAYLDLTSKRRTELLRLLERAESRAANPTLRAFAERALPILRNRGQSPNS